MLRNHLLTSAAIIVAIAVGAQAPALAAFTDITVGNPSFETNSGPADNGNTGAIADWSAIGWTNFVFNPDDPDFADSTDPASSSLPSGPDGTYSAFIFGAAGSNGFSQTLSTAVVADANYRLTYWVGDSAQFIQDAHLVELVTTDGDTIISSNQAAPAANGYSQVTLTGPAPSDATGNLIIRFTDVSDLNTITFIDLVGLEIETAASVPSPAALPAGLAMLALGAMRRRRR